MFFVSVFLIDCLFWFMLFWLFFSLLFCCCRSYCDE